MWTKKVISCIQFSMRMQLALVGPHAFLQLEACEILEFRGDITVHEFCHKEQVQSYSNSQRFKWNEYNYSASAWM